MRVKQPAPEKFLRVTIELPSVWEESLSFILQEEGWGGVIAQEKYPSGILEGENEAQAVPRGATNSLTLLLDPLKLDNFTERFAVIAQEFGLQDRQWNLQFAEHLDQDWEAIWRSRWKPFRCGNFVVHADFHQLPTNLHKAGDRRICMVAGSAFGTGGHSSTRMALRTLQRWWREKPFTNLLDVGTGSGILAVAAAMLGAEKVFGMDPDPASAPQAMATAVANGVERSCHFWRGVGDSATGQWEVVIGNLQSDILFQDAEILAALVSSGGRFFGGGILASKADRTQAKLERFGLKLQKKSRKGHWVTFEMVKD